MHVRPGSHKGPGELDLINQLLELVTLAETRAIQCLLEEVTSQVTVEHWQVRLGYRVLQLGPASSALTLMWGARTSPGPASAWLL